MKCVATCRPGLEGVLLDELRSLDGQDLRQRKRAVEFETDKTGLYRMNMAVRTAIQLLVPIRTFNASDYQLLYYQARRTNWHQLFEPGKTIRIDVNGHSPNLRNTQYVVHRVKDGIVDTFRKLAGGVRPSIDKDKPDIHLVVHLRGREVTLCLDSSGQPLFKRGYRLRHGGAPLKEDLAAGILKLCGAEGYAGLVDPMCGTGTFLFEGWMLRNGIAPNRERDFAFQHWLDYEPDLFEAQQALLQDNIHPDPAPVIGCDSDPEAIELARQIHRDHFPDARIRFLDCPFDELAEAFPGCLMVVNPPYGKRLGEGEDLPALYHELGGFARERLAGGRLALFTTNRKAARRIPMRAESTATLFNGALEGTLYQYAVRDSG